MTFPAASPDAACARQRYDPVIALLIASFPLAWLAFFDKTFYIDWDRHLWMIAYTGEYFRHHLWFPTTFNTEDVVGVPFPIFYGTLFYPVAGIVSAVAGAAIALRVIVLAVFWLQCHQVAALVRTVYPSRGIAWGVAALVCFAVYPLTNLYNRNAITELVAVSLLVSACAILLRAIYSAGARRQWVQVSFAWLLLTLAAGTHPITAVLGSAAFLLLLLAGLVPARHRRAFAAMLAINAPIFAVVLSPWLYATLKFQHELLIGLSIKSLMMYPDSIDAWWTRLVPIPFDIRPLLDPRASTPYLDAQINFGLLMTAAFLIFQVGRRLRAGQMRFTREVSAAAACLALAALVCWCSTSTTVWTVVPIAFFQFTYRLVTYCDLLLLAGVVVLLSALRSQQTVQKPLSICLAAAVAVMATGVLVKFTHVAAIQSDGVLAGIGISGERDALTQMPNNFPWVDYSDVTGLAGDMPDAPLTKLPVGLEAHFGEVGSALNIPGAENLQTTIETFPWNRVVLDGRDVPFSGTYASRRLLGVPLDDNGRSVQHVVGYGFRPDAIYSVLRVTSFVTLGMWAGSLLFLALFLRPR